MKGQNVDKVLQELYLNAKDINDFSKLAIPFACVATNAETGEAVVFDLPGGRDMFGILWSRPL